MEIPWCFSQVKGTIEDEVADGECMCVHVYLKRVHVLDKRLYITKGTVWIGGGLHFPSCLIGWNVPACLSWQITMETGARYWYQTWDFRLGTRLELGTRCLRSIWFVLYSLLLACYIYPFPLLPDLGKTLAHPSLHKDGNFYEMYMYMSRIVLAKTAVPQRWYVPWQKPLYHD